MNQLVNNALRTKNMISLLKAMSINLDNTTVNCHDELVILTPASLKEGQNIVEDIQALLHTDKTKPAINGMSLATLLGAEINAASCTDHQLIDIHKQSLHLLLPILKLDFTLDEQQEYLKIKLPSAAYSSLFSSLTYPFMSINGDMLQFNIKAFVMAHSQELILIDGKSPLLLMHASLFENKKVFYAQKTIDDETVEITPYFFIPDAAKPPQYHFILDTSLSMNGHALETLKSSMRQFASALFDFQPNAIISVEQFSTIIKKLGDYKKEQFNELCCDVSKLEARGLTCLFDAVLDKLSFIQESTQHNNVLLFTDGIDTMNNKRDNEEKLNKLVQSYANQPPKHNMLVRNKFFIISCNAHQPQVLSKVTAAFKSSIISTNDADFVAALSKNEKMQEWAAARELFTCRLKVVGDSVEEYVRVYDRSRQFIPLKPVRCKNTKAYYLEILDGDNNRLLTDKLLINKPVADPLSISSAKVAATLGVFATNTSIAKHSINANDAEQNLPSLNQ